MRVEGREPFATPLPWYQDPGQWGWLAACLIPLVLGCLVLQQWHEGIVLQRDYAQQSNSLTALVQRKHQLEDDLSSYQALLDQYTDQRERLIQEIAKFDTELKLLNERVQGLERVRARVDRLDADFRRFRHAEDKFQANQRALEQDLKVHARQPG